MRRALSATELFAWCLERGGPFNLQTTIGVDGPLDGASLASAVDALQRRQPLLRVAFTDPPGFAPTRAPLTLERLPRRSADDWQRLAHREVNRSLATGEGPLARLVWLDGGDEHEIVLTAQHAVCSGRSLVGVMRRLLADCARRAGGQELDTEALAPRPALEEELGLGRLAGTAARRLAGYRPAGPAHAAAAGGMLAHRKELDREELDELLHRCRSRRHDLSAGLLAALARALAELPCAAGGDGEVDLVSTVDLGPRLPRPPAPGELGYPVSFVTARCPIAVGEPLARLARRIGGEIFRAVERGGELAALAQLQAALEAPDAPARVDGFRLRRPTAGLSNLGVLELPERIGPCRVRALRVTTAAAGFWSHRPSSLLIASTLGGRLQLDLIASAAALDRRELARLGDRLVQLLRQPD